MRTTTMLALGVAMAGAVMANAPAVAQVPVPMQTVVPEGTILDVSATGRVSRTPDVATIRAGVVTQAATAGAASGDNANRMARVIAALKAAGIAARDIATSSLSLQPQYRYAENQPPVVTGYQASNTVSVKFRDIRRSGAVLDALVASGANQIDGPSLSLAEPDAALDAARSDAIVKARARATLYAQAAGLRIDRIVSIAEAGENDGGSPQPPVFARVQMAASRDSATQVLAGDTDVTATLNVRFLLR